MCRPLSSWHQRYRIHHNSWVLKTLLPILAQQRIHSHLLQLDGRERLDQDHADEGIDEQRHRQM